MAKARAWKVLVNQLFLRPRPAWGPYSVSQPQPVFAGILIPACVWSHCQGSLSHFLGSMWCFRCRGNAAT